MKSPSKLKELSFYEALKELSDGKVIKKLEWDEGYYGILKDNKVQLYKPDGKFYDWIISESDLIGEDYVII